MAIARIERDTQRHATRVVALNSEGSRYPWGSARFKETIIHEAQDEHPEATSVRGEHSTTVVLADRTLRWESELTFRSDRTSFYYTCIRRLLKDGALLRERTWEDTIPRDHQ